MFSYTFVSRAEFHIPVMVDEPVLESEHGLSNILYATQFAGYGIDNVRAAARDVLHCFMLFFCVVAGNVACFVDLGAVSAISGVTEIKAPMFDLDSFWGSSRNVCK